MKGRCPDVSRWGMWVPSSDGEGTLNEGTLSGHEPLGHVSAL